MVRAIVAVLVVAIVIVAAAIFLASYGADTTSEVDLYDTGAAAGEGVTGGVADQASAPTGGTPSPPPSQPPAPAPVKIGTYSILVTATFVDGTTQALTGSQAFAQVGYYNCKPLKWLQYKGTFKADQAVTVLGGFSYPTRTGTYFDAYSTKAGSSAREGYFTAATAARPVAAGQTIVVYQSDPTNFWGPQPGRENGNYNVYFSMGLKFRYASNGTDSPQFVVTNPVVGITLADDASPPTCGSGAPPGGGGGGGPPPRRAIVFGIVDGRIWVAYWR